jgi:hypothetical protein
MSLRYANCTYEAPCARQYSTAGCVKAGRSPRDIHLLLQAGKACTTAAATNEADRFQTHLGGLSAKLLTGFLEVGILSFAAAAWVAGVCGLKEKRRNAND